MKIVLAGLMCLVLTASQCFAISGGPVFGGAGVSVTGTYAGVFVPKVDPTVGQRDNSLALFTLVVPRVGLASGTSVVFRNGFSYSGTIQGSADPDSGNLTGVLSASFLVVSSINGTTGTIDINAEYDANGQFQNAHIVADQSPARATTARIKGKALLTYRNDATVGGVTPDPAGDSGGPIVYRIHGFKQSEATG